MFCSLRDLPFLPSLLVFLSAAALPVGASAFEPTGNPVADRFLSMLEAEDGTVESYESFSESGNSVTLRGIKLKDDRLGKTTVLISQAGLTDAEPTSDGRMTVAHLEIKGLDVQAPDGALVIGAFHSTNAVLPSPDEIASDLSATLFKPTFGELEILDTTVTDEDGSQFSVNRIFAATDGSDGDLPTDFRFALEDMVLHTQHLQREGRDALTNLGYDTLTVSASGHVEWYPASEIAVLGPVEIRVDDAAEAKTTFTLTGVSRTIMEELNKSGEEPDDVLSLLQGVGISSASIHVDNAGLVGRVLDQQAKQAGTDRAGMVAQLQSALPLMMTFVKNPDFRTSLTTALTEFLENPVSLSVSADPAAPVPVSQIMGLAFVTPQGLPQLLGLQVSANTPE